jgi:hypothetical protein
VGLKAPYTSQYIFANTRYEELMNVQVPKKKCKGGEQADLKKQNSIQQPV